MIIAIFSLFLQFQAFSATGDLVALNEFNTVKYNNTIDREEVELFVPTNIKDGTDGKTVQKKVLDHSFRNFIKGKMTPGSNILKVVQKVEQTMKYNLVETEKTNEDDIQHKLRFQYKPFQNIAKLKYSGFLNANIEYLLSDSFLQYSLEKDISETAMLQLVQSEDPVSPNKSALTMFNIRLSWN